MRCAPLTTNRHSSPSAPWDASGPIGAAAYRWAVAHPGFPRAARALAPDTLAAPTDDPALDAVFKDAGRYMAALLAVYLHLSGGLTLPRFKAICAASFLLSASRARALLDYLRYLGFIEASAASRRGVATLYTPSSAFMTAWRGHLRAAVEAAAILEPAARALLGRWDDAEAWAGFVRRHTEELLRSTREANPSPAVVRVFMHQFAGNQIIGALAASGGQDEPFPPRSPIHVTHAAMARRYGVSRAHVRRLLAAAEAAGVLRCPGDGTVVLEDAGRADIALYYAMQLIRLIRAAVGAAEAFVEPSADASAGAAA